MAQLVDKQYAKAIFELSVERGAVDAYSEQAAAIYDAFKNNNDFYRTITHPHITVNEKMKLIENVWKDNIAADFLGLFNVLLRKNREDDILDILESFMELVKQHKGITVADISSAVPLTAEQIEQIRNKLESRLAKKVEIVTSVIPELIGGICIKVEGRILDVTVKKQFDEMKKLLKEC